MEKCFADLGNKCDVLKVKKCRNCSFYKTKEQYEEGLKKYPPIEKENKVNKVNCILRNKTTDEVLEFPSLAQLGLFLGMSRGWACQKAITKGDKFDYKDFEIEIRR